MSARGRKTITVVRCVRFASALDPLKNNAFGRSDATDGKNGLLTWGTSGDARHSRRHCSAAKPLLNGRSRREADGFGGYARLLCVAVLLVIFHIPSVLIRLWKSIQTSDGVELRSQTICKEAMSPTWVTETIRPTTPQLGGAAQCAKFSEIRFFVSLPSAST